MILFDNGYDKKDESNQNVMFLPCFIGEKLIGSNSSGQI
jgi:hypothetical protein